MLNLILYEPLFWMSWYCFGLAGLFIFILLESKYPNTPRLLIQYSILSCLGVFIFIPMVAFFFIYIFQNKDFKDDFDQPFNKKKEKV